MIDRKMNGGEAYGVMEAQYIRRHHSHEPRENQCSSTLVKHIRAPVHLVSYPYEYDLTTYIPSDQSGSLIHLLVRLCICDLFLIDLRLFDFFSPPFLSFQTRGSE